MAACREEDIAIKSAYDTIIYKKLYIINCYHKTINTGEAGFFATVGMLLIGEAMTALTALSLSAIVTNGDMRGGGSYYMIRCGMLICSGCMQLNAGPIVVGLWAPSTADPLAPAFTWHTVSTWFVIHQLIVPYWFLYSLYCINRPSKRYRWARRYRRRGCRHRTLTPAGPLSGSPAPSSLPSLLLLWLAHTCSRALTYLYFYLR